MGFLSLFQTLSASFRRDGATRLLHRFLDRRHLARYSEWLAGIAPQQRRYQEELVAKLPTLTFSPTFSILLPVYRPDRELLEAAVRSVEAQLYSSWELCIVDDGSGDTDLQAYLHQLASREPRIKVQIAEQNGHISEASNRALLLATGDYCLMLDQDDLLAPQALALCAVALNEPHRAQLLFADEDKITPGGARCEPYFKPGLDRVLLRSQNLCCHPTVISVPLVREVGGFRTGVEGAQDWDLTLRVLERLSDTEVCWIPEVLYHWRKGVGSTASSLSQKGYVQEAQLRVVREHCKRMGIEATVEPVSSRIPFRLRGLAQEPELLEFFSFEELLEKLEGVAGNARPLLLKGRGVELVSGSTVRHFADGLLHPEVELVGAVLEDRGGRVRGAGFFEDRAVQRLRPLHWGAARDSDGYGNSLIAPHLVAMAPLLALLIRPTSLARFVTVLQAAGGIAAATTALYQARLRVALLPEVRVRAAAATIQEFLGGEEGFPLPSGGSAHFHPYRATRSPQMGLAFPPRYVKPYAL